MVALPPISATSSLPGFVRPVASSAEGAGNRSVQSDIGAPIGGGAATSAIANEARRTLVEQSKQAQGQDAGNPGNRPRAQLPAPPYAQSVGLYDNSTRVYVDIVLSSDESRRIARVFGTPPAPPQPVRTTAVAAGAVNFVA